MQRHKDKTEKEKKNKVHRVKNINVVNKITTCIPLKDADVSE